MTSDTQGKANFITFVIPCFNEGTTLTEIAKQLNNTFIDVNGSQLFKFLFIDDGSSDDTWNIIEELKKHNQRIAGIRLSRNFGHQKALLAGLEYATRFSTYILSMDCDLQHPVSAAKELVELATTQGYDIVSGQRLKDEQNSLFKRSTSRLFYKTLNLMGAEIAPNVSDFRIMSQRAAQALISHGDAAFFTRGVISLIGFKQAVIPYRQAARFAGSTKYSTRKMLRLASEGITSLSIAPLRLTFAISVILILACIAMLIRITIVWLAGEAVEGWASILFSIYALFGINFLLIGLQGEYVGKTYFQTLKRPRYIVQEILDN